MAFPREKILAILRKCATRIPLAIFAGTLVFIAILLTILSLNCVQKSIIVFALDCADIQADCDEFKMRGFSRYEIKNVRLRFADGNALLADKLTLEAPFFGIFFSGTLEIPETTPIFAVPAGATNRVPAKLETLALKFRSGFFKKLATNFSAGTFCGNDFGVKNLDFVPEKISLELGDHKGKIAIHSLKILACGNGGESLGNGDNLVAGFGLGNGDNPVAGSKILKKVDLNSGDKIVAVPKAWNSVPAGKILATIANSEIAFDGDDFVPENPLAALKTLTIRAIVGNGAKAKIASVPAKTGELQRFEITAIADDPARYFVAIKSLEFSPETRDFSTTGTLGAQAIDVYDLSKFLALAAQKKHVPAKPAVNVEIEKSSANFKLIWDAKTERGELKLVKINAKTSAKFAKKDRKSRTLGNLLELGGSLAEVVSNKIVDGGQGKSKKIVAAFSELSNYFHSFSIDDGRAAIEFDSAGTLNLRDILLKNSQLIFGGSGNVDLRERHVILDGRLDAQGKIGAALDLFDQNPFPVNIDHSF